MVALPHMNTAAESGGWQNIRDQLFGQKRERDAEDGLLTLITQTQTRLAVALGAHIGPLHTPVTRALALRAVQDGLNAVLAWHRDQIASAQVVGWWTGPVPELSADIVAAVKEVHPLLECAQAAGGKVDATDTIHSVAQLRGPESDAYFNDLLGAFLAMLEAIYTRIGIDAPTAATAFSLQATWDLLIDELRALACPVAMQEEVEAVVVDVGVAVVAVVDAVDSPMGHPERSEGSEPRVDMDGDSTVALHLSPRFAWDDSTTQDEGATRDPSTVGAAEVLTLAPVEPAPPSNIIFRARFYRYELVAC
ncbi:MAG TPA: hypothetical protein VNM48_06655 [Chloroflexota bacterium]|nr:hypothetical protein [Chloroflexota bacterium]